MFSPRPPHLAHEYNESNGIGCRILQTRLDYRLEVAPLFVISKEILDFTPDQNEDTGLTIAQSFKLACTLRTNVIHNCVASTTAWPPPLPSLGPNSHTYWPHLLDNNKIYAFYNASRLIYFYYRVKTTIIRPFKEGHILLAIQALVHDPQLTVKRASIQTN